MDPFIGDASIRGNLAILSNNYEFIIMNLLLNNKQRSNDPQFGGEYEMTFLLGYMYK